MSDRPPGQRFAAVEMGREPASFPVKNVTAPKAPRLEAVDTDGHTVKVQPLRVPLGEIAVRR